MSTVFSEIRTADLTYCNRLRRNRPRSPRWRHTGSAAGNSTFCWNGTDGTATAWVRIRVELKNRKQQPHEWNSLVFFFGFRTVRRWVRRRKWVVRKTRSTGFLNFFFKKKIPTATRSKPTQCVHTTCTRRKTWHHNLTVRRNTSTFKTNSHIALDTKVVWTLQNSILRKTDSTTYNTRVLNRKCYWNFIFSGGRIYFSFRYTIWKWTKVNLI